MLNMFFAQCTDRASFSVWLYRFSVTVIVRLMKWTGCAVSDAYLGMNFDRYLVMPRKLLTASFDSGGLLSFTALIFSGFRFNPSFVNLCP